MQLPVPSSSRKGCSERPELIVRHDWRRLPLGPDSTFCWTR
jgi:hypothetical protein